MAQDSELKIPDGVTFHDLEISRDPNGRMSINYEVLTEFLKANSVEAFHDDVKISRMLEGWYSKHLSLGGNPDFNFELIRDSVHRKEGEVSTEDGRVTSDINQVVVDEMNVKAFYNKL